MNFNNSLKLKIYFKFYLIWIKRKKKVEGTIYCNDRVYVATMGVLSIRFAK